MRILIVEDNENLCELIQDQLEASGIDADICMDGEEAVFHLENRVHDLVLLDRMLPGKDGLTILRKARGAGNAVPIILMTALGALEQVVEGLDAGADDYIVKPFAADELLARIRAIQRRPQGYAKSPEIAAGGLSLDPAARILRCRARECTLSRRECALLELLMKAPGKPRTREVIFDYVWGGEADVEDGNIDNYIHFLRSRFLQIQTTAQIKTIRGVGYMLEVAEDGT